MWKEKAMYFFRLKKDARYHIKNMPNIRTCLWWRAGQSETPTGQTGDRRKTGSKLTLCRRTLLKATT